MKLSIIIPVYNEEKTIGQVIEQVAKIEISPVIKEIVVVNDSSTDGTAKKLDALQKKYTNLHIYSHRENKGKGAAVRTGMKQASGDYIVIQDADLEYDPVQLKKLMQPIVEKKSQVVFGTRLTTLPKVQGSMPRGRFLAHYFGNRFLSLVTSVLYGQWITDMETCYKIFPREALKKFTLSGDGFNFEPEITAKLIKAGYNITELPIQTQPRGYTEGKKLQTIPEGFRALQTLIRYRFINK